jgi:glycosyltransferase involved in cell wall biosynthesis
MSIMKKKNVIQFLPYFPPHVWGVEKVWEDIFLKWTYWKSIVCSWEKDNYKYVYNKDIDINIDSKKYFWYPCFDIVDNFPIPLIWTKRYRNATKSLEEIVNKNPEEDFYVITHTRFFLSSFIGGRFARKNKLKWIHIEHGSDYVKLSSKFKSKVAYFYDKSIWKYIFNKADKVLAISKAAEKFINNEFSIKATNVWYRGVDFPIINNEEDLRKRFQWDVIIWYVWRLYKWKNVEWLIKSYYNVVASWKNKLQLIIVWDGEDLGILKKLDTKNIIHFTWGVTERQAYSYQNEFDLHIHSSSSWWGLATTLMQAMNLWCLIVATPYEWADEVIEDDVNWFLLQDDSVIEITKWIMKWLDNFEKKEEFAKYNSKIITKRFELMKSISDLYSLID